MAMRIQLLSTTDRSSASLPFLWNKISSFIISLIICTSTSDFWLYCHFRTYDKKGAAQYEWIFRVVKVDVCLRNNAGFVCFIHLEKYCILSTCIHYTSTQRDKLNLPVPLIRMINTLALALATYRVSESVAPRRGANEHFSRMDVYQLWYVRRPIQKSVFVSSRRIRRKNFHFLSIGIYDNDIFKSLNQRRLYLTSRTFAVK